MDEIMRSLTLESSWHEKILAEVTSLSERERVLKERRRTEDKLRRLARAYIDGLIDEADYAVQRSSLLQVLETLVIPEADATLNAGKFLDNLGTVWQEASLEERHRILVNMLEAVYVDLVCKSIVGLVPKPPFYRLFESLETNRESKVLIVNAERLVQDGDKLLLKKEIASGEIQTQGDNLVLVETGES